MGQDRDERSRGLLSSGLVGIGAEHAPGVAQRADNDVESGARALDRHQPGPGADLGAEGGDIGLRLDGGVEALGVGHRPAARSWQGSSARSAGPYSSAPTCRLAAPWRSQPSRRWTQAVTVSGARSSLGRSARTDTGSAANRQRPSWRLARHTSTVRAGTSPANGSMAAGGTG